MAVTLPIDAALPSILEKIKRAGALVLTADPGAGKTTRVPPALARAFPGKVLVLEPRRIAAIASALRVAEEQGWTVGEEVGYWVRHDPRFNDRTRLIFLTEALLTRRMLSDPRLEGISAVILDEFHERSIHCDLAIGLLKELRSLERPDLRLVVMSATIQAEKIAAFLDDAPVEEVPGRLFPMTIALDKNSQLLQTTPQFIDRVAAKIQEALTKTKAGDVLVFLPGVGEIERVKRQLQPLPIEVHALHGRLEADEQKRVLRAGDPARRRVILATNVAESALTIDGVAVVVDAGLERVSRLHPKTMRPSLGLQRISKASATQRAGRSARQTEGHVFRLWNQFDERSMPDEIPAEILREDLCATLLFLAEMGIADFAGFSWYEAPAPAQLRHAADELLAIGALEKGAAGFRITLLGKQMLSLPLHPRLAKIVIEAARLGMGEWGARFAVLLHEKLPADKGGPAIADAENDLLDRWDTWRRQGSRNLDRALAQIEQLMKIGKSAAPYDHARAQELFLRCFPDSLCRRRTGGGPKALMVGGRGVTLAPESQVRRADFFIALDFFEKEQGADTHVNAAIGLTEEFVRTKMGTEAKRDRTVRWDDERGDFYAFEGQTWRGLPLDTGSRGGAKPDEAFPFLVDHAEENWSELLAKNEALGAWIGRFLKWKSTAELAPALRRAWIEAAAYGANNWKTLLEKDWVPFLETALEPAELKELNRAVPRTLELPSGRHAPIHYPPDKAPYLETKMQELFGLPDGPVILGQKLTFHMLGPNFRPVQITSDLAGFWKSSYLEIRKELRIRYPKHYWPEDPLQAEPKIFAKPRRS